MANDELMRQWTDPDQTSLEDLYIELARTSPQSDALGGDLAKRGRAMLLALRSGCCHVWTAPVLQAQSLSEY